MTPRRPSNGTVRLMLPPLEAIDQLADEQVPAVLTHLGAMLVRLSARQAAGQRREEPIDDELLDIEQVAELTRRSVSWLHHHGQKIPGFRQSHGKGGRKFWSRRAIRAWMTKGDAA